MAGKASVRRNRNSRTIHLEKKRIAGATSLFDADGLSGPVRPGARMTGNAHRSRELSGARQSSSPKTLRTHLVPKPHSSSQQSLCC